ncbi:MAG: hypothetical protein HDS77_01835 [Bacteroidales bacterium]|nr:hypothetical protein [Bacteroidales bacterium]MBD5235785.1 hypothetical protein [Barnesiella sp.]
MKRISKILLPLIALAAVLSATAQRRVTPIDTPATATQHINENKANGDSIDRSRLVEMTDSRGNTILVDTVTGTEFVDTLAAQRVVPKMIYPLLHSASVSFDLFTPATRAFGTKYGLGEIAAEVNLHNRYIPVVEIGLGQANTTPDDNNYTYRTPVSPFFRIGMNYNFLYQSNPDYLIMAGVRYGFSPFKYEVTDITQQPGYWDEPMTYSIPSQSVTAGYFQILLALRVRVFDNVSLGWSVRYQSLLHDTDTPYGNAWYIPGYGPRNRSINATFAVSYTVSLTKFNKPSEATEQVLESLGDIPPATDTDSDATDGNEKTSAETTDSVIDDNGDGNATDNETITEQPLSNQ